MTAASEMDTKPQSNGVVTGSPKLVLEAEGALVLAAATYAYNQTHLGWLLYAVLFLAPDIFMLGYFANTRVGSIIYNFGHTYVVPAALFGLGWGLSAPVVMAIALIWIGHIGFDRMLGYGLKYESGFKNNHLSSASA